MQPIAYLSLATTVALLSIGSPASAQIPDAPKPIPASLFRNQCGTCHVINPADGVRQGPPLAGIVGRKPGTVPGFKYAGDYSKVDFTWDAAHLDTYLTDPQAMIPGTTMAYRQANPDTRTAIIAYLTEQH